MDPSSIKTFIMQNADVVDRFVSGKLEMIFKKPEDLKNDEGAVVKANGKRAALMGSTRSITYRRYNMHAYGM